LTTVFPAWSRDHSGGSASVPRDTGATDDTVRETVSALWQRLIGRPPRSVDEDFFAAGGSLLEAAAYASLLSEMLECDIGVQFIYDHPTVRTLATSIRSRGVGSPSRVLPLGRDGDGAPLLFIPGAFGNPATFTRFGEPRFGRRVYGVEYRGLRPDTGEPLRGVPEMATDLADEIERRCPAEPVHVTGYCTGAVYALELARILIGRGWPVRSLVMLSPGTQDPEPVYFSYDEALDDRLTRIFAEAGLDAYDGPFTADAVSTRLRARGVEVTGDAVDEVIASARMFVSNLYAVSRYEPFSPSTPPPPPVGVPVTVVLPDDDDGDDAFAFWPGALGAGATFHRFACGHMDVPFDDDVLAAVATAMRDADGAAPSVG
jgi:hypothetical protein